ncbi:MAG: dephospho-CoA kinase [Bacteroidetes bacterium]|jgi:dephospho-CoA kinase|nr:dephospho-CoA kinase [Bacteroidota bacterium]
MKRIGLTGGIGSGKTTVAEVFKTLGIPVFLADEEARRIQNEVETVKNKIQQVLGDVYDINGTLNRKRVAELVFGNPSLLEQLNQIVHPAVKDAFEKFVASHTDAPYVIREAAILFESGSYKDLDAVIAVVAPEEIRINRVMNRDSSTKEQVQQRIQAQWSDEEKVRRSQFVIINDGKEMILPAIVNIHEELMKA